MAKKDFKGGLSGIIPDKSVTSTNTGEKTIVEKKGSATPPKEKKHSLTVDSEQLDKLRYIAKQDRVGLKKAVYESFKAFIEKYEKKNGEIIIK